MEYIGICIFVDVNIIDVNNVFLCFICYILHFYDTIRHDAVDYRALKR